MRIVLIVLLFLNSVFAKDISATYKVSFGIFGQIGTAKTSLHVEDNRYKINVLAKSTGFAAFISGGRTEFYESRGKVLNGILIPEIYKKIIQRKVNIGDTFSGESKTVIKKYILIYKFNHRAKKIVATKIHIKGKSRSEHSEVLKFYAKNDILSIFFNFKKLFPNLTIKKKYLLHAAGAGKKRGDIHLFPATKKEFSKLLSGKLDNLKFMKVVLSDKIFASKKGELYLALDNNGICEKAVLKDVIFFGDIRGELIEKSYK